MLVQPDFSEISEDIKPGTYKVRVTGADSGEWSTGTKYIKWMLETFGEEDAKNEGRKIWYSTPIAGKGAFLTKRFWDAATGGQDIPNEGFDTEMLLGKEIEVVTDMNDRNYVEVKAVRKIQ